MKGFTLVELLVVIGIIVILMTAALIAINPFRQFAMANNANRWSGVTTIMNAISQRMVDNRGSVTWDCDGDSTNDPIPTSTTNMSSIAGDYDICGCLVSDADADFDDYIASMPYDQQDASTHFFNSCSDYNTGYSILRDATTNRITISAPSAQLGETITITR